MIFDDDYLKFFLKNKEYIYITVVTKEFSDMAYNWFLSLKKIKQEHLALIVALDEECYEEIKKLNIPCLYLKGDVNQNESYGDWVENEKLNKLVIPIHISRKYKTNLIFADVDIFFFKNPIEKLKKEIKNYDLVTMSDKRFDPFLYKRKLNNLTKINYDKTNIVDYGTVPQFKYGIMNGGFFYFPPRSKNSDELLDSLHIFKKNSEELKKYPKRTEEGTLQNILIKLFDINNFKINILNPFEFVNGSIIQTPYLKEKITKDAFLFHYNFVEPDTPLNMKDKKIKLMKENGHWFL
jgi:hypothetical protein